MSGGNGFSIRQSMAWASPSLPGPPPPPRGTHAAAVCADRLWVMGGDSPAAGALQMDVWSLPLRGLAEACSTRADAASEMLSLSPTVHWWEEFTVGVLTGAWLGGRRHVWRRAAAVPRRHCVCVRPARAADRRGRRVGLDAEHALLHSNSRAEDTYSAGIRPYIPLCSLHAFTRCSKDSAQDRPPALTSVHSARRPVGLRTDGVALAAARRGAFVERGPHFRLRAAAPRRPLLRHGAHRRRRVARLRVRRRDTSSTPPRHLLDTSSTPPRHLLDAS